MPELPEVETTRRGILPKLQGQVIQSICVRQPALRWPIPVELSETLNGLQISHIKRRAKYLLISLHQPTEPARLIGTLIIHLGMSGSLRFATHDTPPEKHDHVDFIFADYRLRYRDPRRFGAILWTTQPIEQHLLLSTLGVEPLSDALTATYLYQRAQSSHSAIKPWIMNQHIVVGIGNIYANEALFCAGIHPAKAAKRLSLNELQILVTCIRAILHKAIAAGGSSLRDFVQSSGNPGYFQQTYRVYGRQGQACLQCGILIKHLQQGQRRSFYCPGCQPL